MTFEIVPAHEVSFAEQAKIFNRAFAGYLAGWHEMNADAVARFICAQGIDLCYSRFARVKGEIGSFGFINRTGNVSRLAGMGTVPDARRTGAAAFLLSHLLDEAKQRSDEAMVLEVFEQNTQALPLYQRYGFRELMRLLGWRRSPAKMDAPRMKDLREISLLEAAAMQTGPDFPDVPWQVSRHVVPKLSGVRAYKIDDGCVVIGNPDTPPVRIYALFGDEQNVKDVLAAILAQHPGKEFFAPAIFPEQLHDQVFVSLGFAREKLNQLLMRRDLR